MLSNGYIRVYRNERNDWLRKDPERYLWWLDLRMWAAPFEMYIAVGKSRVEFNLKHGQFATTYTDLSYEWRVTEKTARKFIDLMVKCKRIKTEDKSGCLLIEVINFEYYSPPVGYFSSSGNSRFDELDEFEMSGDSKTEGIDQEELPKELPTSLPTSNNRKNNKKIKSENKKNPDELIAREVSFFEELKESQTTVESMCATLQDTPDKLVEMLTKFHNYCLSTDHYHTSFSDFKKHFMNWRPKQKKENIEQSQTSQYGKQEKNGAAQRRGTEGSAKRPDDFDQPFPVRGHQE